MLVGLGLLGLLYISISLRANLFLYASRLTEQRINLATWLEELGIDAPTVLTQELFSRQMLIGTTARLLTNLGSLVVTGVFVLVTTVFLLLQTTHLSERIDREWGPGNLLNAQAAQVAQRVASFFSIRVRVNLIVATAITIWLAILGVDLAVLWGILAFFLGFIMYIGVTIAALPPALLALAESGPWWAVLAFLGVLLINMGIENIVAPAMMGQGLNLTPAVALASLVFWAWVLRPPRLYPRYPPHRDRRHDPRQQPRLALATGAVDYGHHSRYGRRAKHRKHAELPDAQRNSPAPLAALLRLGQRRRYDQLDRGLRRYAPRVGSSSHSNVDPSSSPR